MLLGLTALTMGWGLYWPHYKEEKRMDELETSFSTQDGYMKSIMKDYQRWNVQREEGVFELLTEAEEGIMNPKGVTPKDYVKEMVRLRIEKSDTPTEDLRGIVGKYFAQEDNVEGKAYVHRWHLPAEVALELLPSDDEYFRGIYRQAVGRSARTPAGSLAGAALLRISDNEFIYEELIAATREEWATDLVPIRVTAAIMYLVQHERVIPKEVIDKMLQAPNCQPFLLRYPIRQSTNLELLKRFVDHPDEKVRTSAQRNIRYLGQ